MMHFRRKGFTLLHWLVGLQTSVCRALRVNMANSSPGWAAQRPRLNSDTHKPINQQMVIEFISFLFSSEENRFTSQFQRSVLSLSQKGPLSKGFRFLRKHKAAADFVCGSESDSPFSVVMVHSTGSFSGCSSSDTVQGPVYLPLSRVLTDRVTDGEEVQISFFSRTTDGQFSLKLGTSTYTVPVEVLPVFSVRIVIER